MARSGLTLLFPGASAFETWKRSYNDVLLMTAAVLLTIMLIGVIIGEIAAIIGLISAFAVTTPFAHPITDPVWTPIAAFGFAAVALGVIAGGIGDVLAIIGTVADRDPFAAANASRIEQLGWRVLALAAIGKLAAWLGTPVGGDFHGFTVAVDFGGGHALAFALVLFILARVFHHGDRLNQEMEGTV